MPSESLAEAQKQVLAEAERREAMRGVRPTSRLVSSGLLVTTLASWLLALGLLLFQPDIARGPTPQRWAPTPATAEASLRYGLWLAKGRVASFVRVEARVPAFLSEAGVEDNSITVTGVQGREYVLEGREGELVLRLTSAMAADSFLGTSRAQLRGR